MARLKPEDRKNQILNAAVTVAKSEGLNKMTRDAVAEHAGVAMGLVNHYFSTMVQLRRAVIRNAIHQLDGDNPTDEHLLSIVAQGLISKESAAQKAPESIKQAAVQMLM